MKTTFEPIKINRISKSESRQSVMNLKKSFSKAKFRSVFKIDIVEANLEKVWVAANGKGTWKLCNIVSRNDTMLTLLDASGDRLSVDTRHIQTHPYNNNFVSDMSSLRHLNEPSIYHNISMRYKEHMPYSYMGTVLIAMNPFQYTAEPEITQYAGLRLNPELPHPFALSELSYQQLCVKNSINQSIIVSGESGAGKTETAKLIIKYLVERSALNLHAKNDSSKLKSGSATVAAALLQSSPVLEAFGNSKTLRNSNSSRFGKYMKIYFSPINDTTIESTSELCVAGVNIETYLLEKGRVTAHIDGERNYHIFYYLLAAIDRKRPSVSAIYLPYTRPSQYRNLNDNCGDELMDVWWNENMENYLEKFDEVENCLRAIECTSDQITKIWRCVAAILDISNFSFDFANSSEGLVAEVSQQHIQSHAASLLGIDSDSLCRLLTTREMFTGKETFEIRLNVSDAIDVRNAVCRVLYDRLFHKIVKIINTHINNDNNTDDLVSMKSIGVLDIFGFETFNVNGMDQLLINFANEALQNSFNRKLFQNELLIYKDEDIICNLTIDACPDNRGCMDIIASKGSPSIFSILNNISRSQKPLDEIFCETMHKQLIENSNHHYFCNVHAKDKKRKFIIRHSIGDITYSVAENGPLTWIDKNKDNIPDGIDDCMGKSTSSIVQSLFLSENTMTIPHNKSVKSLRRTTVVERFSQDISNLCAMLHLTSCNFIRCIKPNSISQPLHVEEKFVYDQIRALGLVQCCEVMKIGLPTRITFVELKEACKSVLNSNDSSVIASANDETLVFALMWALEIPDSTYYIGKTRVFFKVGQLETLDKILAGKFDPERVRSRLLKAITTRNEMNNEIEQLHSRVVQSEEAVKVNKEQFLQLQTHCKTVNSKIIPFSESIRQTKDNIDRVTSILEVSFHAVNTVTINSSAVASHVGYNSLKFTIGEVTNTLKETNGRYLNINATFMTTEAFYASGALQSVDVAVEDRVRELVAINTLQTEILSQEKIARQDASNCSDTFQGRVDDCDNSLSILKHRTKKNLNAIHEDIKALVNMDSDVNEYESQLRQLTVTINEIISSAEQVVRLCAKLREDISKMQEDIAVDEAEKERLREEAKQREEELLRAEFEEKKQFLVAEAAAATIPALVDESSELDGEEEEKDLLAELYSSERVKDQKKSFNLIEEQGMKDANIFVTSDGQLTTAKVVEIAPSEWDANVQVCAATIQTDELEREIQAKTQAEVLTGVIYKRYNLFTKYTRKYFCLDENVFSYRSKWGLVLEMVLTPETIINENAILQYHFTIQTDKTKWVLKLNNENDYNKWISALRYAISKSGNVH